MKRILTLFVIAAFAALTSTAGGLVTNTNQSARFTRMMALDALHGIDAVYYNPAGLTMLGNGFYISLNNQFIGQTKTINSDYPYLMSSPKEYTGNVSANLFPGIYAAYRTGKLAFSVGVNPIGGGGGAVYDDGLPSFEYQLAGVIPTLETTFSALNPLLTLAGMPTVTFDGYDMDMYFEGTSIYMGYQANVSYKINDMFSFALGGRYVTAKNTTMGYVHNFEVDVPNYGGMQAPGSLLRSFTVIPGLPQIIKDQLNAGADQLDAQTTVDVEYEESGSGFTPVFSLNVMPVENLSLAVKYEGSTKLQLTRTIIDGNDGGGMYTDGDTVVADMPAMLAIGAAYKANDNILISTGAHVYFDKNNDYDGMVGDDDPVMIDRSFIEFALGAEYKVGEQLKLSAGWLLASTGVNENYQRDSRFSLASNTIGAGIGYKLNDNACVNLGASYTIYSDYTKSFDTPTDYTETYGNSTWVVGVGLNINLAQKAE